MAIEDRRKKKKVVTNRNQRITGGQATGGGASINNAGNTGVQEPKTLGDFATGNEEGAISATRIPVQSGGTRGSLADFAKGDPEGSITSRALNTRIPIQSGGTRGSLGDLGNTTDRELFTPNADPIVDQINPTTVNTDPAAPIGDTVNTPLSQVSESVPTEANTQRTGLNKTGIRFGDTSSPNSVDFGSDEANAAAAERFRTGNQRGSVNTVSTKNILESNRLTNARSAVAKLKAGGASASAQLHAFRRISKGGEVDRRQALTEQFQEATARGDDLGAREISRSIDRFDTSEQARKTSEAGVETDRQQLGVNAAKVQNTLKDEGVKFDKDTNNLLQDLVKVDQISGESVFDRATRSDQLTRRLGNTSISSNLFQSVFPDFFKDGITNSSLDAFRADPSISDTLKLKARDALIAQQQRR